MSSSKTRNRPPAGDAVSFFDRISGTYRDKYSGQSPFHRYYFNERLDKAINGLDLDGKDVLDIGSGTGNLYDALIRRFPQVNFHATDVSTGMLAQSRVPRDHQFCGHAYDHDFPVQSFDAIFMLGVTTYLDRTELERNLSFVAHSLKAGGVAIITFTNKHSLDHLLRALFRIPVRFLGSRDNVLSSDIRTHAYSYKEVRQLLSPFLCIRQIDVHNHTIFPLNLLLPRPSLFIAERLARVPGSPSWLRFLSSDLLVHLNHG